MKTDFPTSPLPLPHPSQSEQELALLGGPAMLEKEFRRTVFPIITKEDILQMMVGIKADPDAIVSQFEEEYRRYVGANHALATASGTASLHLALVGAGVEPGDEVIVPAFTFIATAQAVVAAKAIPIFVDIDPDTYCMDPSEAEKAISARTKAIMPVHVHGLPADLGRLATLCDRYGLKLVEDASHAHSAGWQERLCGSIGDAAGQSLMADKNFPVGGEGGIAFFKTRAAYERACAFLEHSGIDYRMSWVVASFGISQLRRLPYYDAIRARNAAYLAHELGSTRLFSAPVVPEGCRHAFNMYRIRVHPERIGLADLSVWKVKAAVQELLVAEGVPAREWQNQPIPTHLPFQNRRGFGKGLPFRLSVRDDLGYARENYPNMLRMLESTLLLCRELRSPIEYERIQAYALAFAKVAKRPDAIRKLVRENDYPLPYHKDARLG